MESKQHAGMFSPFYMLHHDSGVSQHGRNETIGLSLMQRNLGTCSSCNPTFTGLAVSKIFLSPLPKPLTLSRPINPMGKLVYDKNQE